MTSFDVNYHQGLGTLLGQAIGMQDFVRLVHICHYVIQTEHLGGSVVELGCNQGRTAKLISALTQRDVHIYDSFEGLPKEEGYNGGEMGASVAGIEVLFQEHPAGVTPTIHKGWFNELTPADVPDAISFAHLDGDMYSSTLLSLELVYPKMVSRGVILVDDYLNTNWTGVEKALVEFFADKVEVVANLKGLHRNPSLKALIVKV